MTNFEKYGKKMLLRIIEKICICDIGRCPVKKQCEANCNNCSKDCENCNLNCTKLLKRWLRSEAV